MVTKTFRSETMLKALQLVQEELGADAIVVSTREIPTGPSWNPWKQSSVEIVAALPDVLPDNKKNKPTSKKSTTQAPVLRPAANKKGVEFVEEMPEIEWVDEADNRAYTPSTINSAQSQKPAQKTRQWDPAQAGPAESQVADKVPERQPKNKPQQTVADLPFVAPSSASTKKSVQKPVVNLENLPAGLKKIRIQLINQGVDQLLVDGLINVAIETLSPGILADYETCKKYITQLLAAEIRVQQGLGVYVPSNVICLVGASGSGKTATIAKMALYFGRELNKTITWVCADTVRMGAIAEARAYTDALGLELRIVYHAEDLREILKGAKETDLFLLDTPGYNPCSEIQMVELGALITGIAKRCTYLVSPATTKEMDLFQLSASFGVFNLDGIIITKLDETHTFGSIYNFARKNQIPLGFFTTGKEVARNFEVVDPIRLVSALFGREWNK